MRRASFEKYVLAIALTLSALMLLTTEAPRTQSGTIILSQTSHHIAP